MTRALFLGAGASPGVPSLSCGFGCCNPDNPKNIRSRASTIYELNGIRLLVDASPDLRLQFLRNDIKYLDGILITHPHFDHIGGIDELREINRINHKPINIYAPNYVIRDLKKRYAYMVINNAKEEHNKYSYENKGGIVLNVIKPNHEFYIKDLKIEALKLLGHNVPSCGYIINNEIVHLGDFKEMSLSAEKRIFSINPKLMVFPLTIIAEHRYHLGLEKVLYYVDKFKPERVVLNHMASECDYDYVNEHTPSNVEPAFDNLELKW